MKYWLVYDNGNESLGCGSEGKRRQKQLLNQLTCMDHVANPMVVAAPSERTKESEKERVINIFSFFLFNGHRESSLLVLFLLYNVQTNFLYISFILINLGEAILFVQNQH